jgi:hypothetical protein
MFPDKGRGLSERRLLSMAMRLVGGVLFGLSEEAKAYIPSKKKRLQISEGYCGMSNPRDHIFLYSPRKPFINIQRIPT